MSIKILFFGDIFGKIGREAIKKILPELQKKYQPDLVLANAENLAHGRGVTPATIEEMQEAGIDFFTSGNHVWDKQTAADILNPKNSPLLRPANYLENKPGQGEKLLKIGQNNLLVINLIGRVFFKEQEDFSCPFIAAKQIIDKYQSKKLAGIIIDFHAEATSEKKALGFYLDGQVSAVIGTHTHVQTADEQILPNSTAYLTDLGMTGPKDSVIGLDKQTIINNFINETTKSANVPEAGICQINAVYLEINPKTKQVQNIERINTEIEI
jgi:metallophosphoesterase (TIGR00282 family)